MSLRTRFMLAFLLLAVLPLTVITVYSYASSTRALRHAAAAESARTAESMQRRMGTLTADLGQRVTELGTTLALPANAQTPNSPPGRGEDFLASILGALGDSARFVETLEITRDEPADDAAPELPVAPVASMAPMGPVIIRLSTELERWAEGIERDAGQSETATAEEAQRLAQRVGVEFGERAGTLARLVAVETRRRLDEVRQKLGGPPDVPLLRDFVGEWRREGAIAGRLTARVRTDRLVNEVLAATVYEPGEIPFMIDPQGALHAPDEAAAKRLQELDIVQQGSVAPPDDWVVVTVRDPGTELTYGLARPVGESLSEIRRAAVRNFGVGLGLVGLALIGTLPLSRRMTRDLSLLTEGAERLAAGDLETRVLVHSKDELGRLAETFNRMARDLEAQQQQLVEKERLRRELEMCRQIQAELLPRSMLRLPLAQVLGTSIPAHELGGDFFNYFPLADGCVALVMGDVSGKGVPAALLMANLQATLTARLALAQDLAAFMTDIDRELSASTPAAVYVSLFLAVLDTQRGELRWVNAGHPPPCVVRVGGRVERLQSTGRPVGLLPGGGYDQRITNVEVGDALFAFTDGLLDAEDPQGRDFGVDRLERLLSAPAQGPTELLSRVETAFHEHRAGCEAPDDATLMAVRIGR